MPAPLGKMRGSDNDVEDDLLRAVDELGDDDHLAGAGVSGAGRSQDVADGRRTICRSNASSGGGDRSRLRGVRAIPVIPIRREKFLYPDMQPIGCMSTASTTIDHLLGEIASLPFEDQALLHEVIGHRLVEARRKEIADEAAAARAALERGEVRRGTTAELLTGIEPAR